MNIIDDELQQQRFIYIE